MSFLNRCRHENKSINTSWLVTEPERRFGGIFLREGGGGVVYPQKIHFQNLVSISDRCSKLKMLFVKTFILPYDRVNEPPTISNMSAEILLNLSRLI